MQDLRGEEGHLQRIFSLFLSVSKDDGWTEEIVNQPLISWLTLNSATGFLLGSSVDSLLEDGKACGKA
jgi:hypothetical protein